jgi:drug/metabolite transporter (DMT)-like permease
MSATARGDVEAVPTPQKQAPQAPTVVLAAFLVMVLLGGANFVAVRFSNAELPPFWGAGSRFIISAVILALIGLALRVPFPRGRTLVGSGLYGVLGFGAFYALAYVGLQEASAGSGAVLLSLAPLTTFLLAFVQGQERFRWRALVGALVALAGIVVMFGAPGGVPLGSAVAFLLAAVAVGEAGVIAKRFPEAHPVSMNAVAMGVGSVLLLVLSRIAGESWELPTRTATLTALVYLILLGSVGLFVLYLFILKRWTASRTAYAFVLFPVVASLLGLWLEGEPITLALALGGVIVLGGVYIGALRGAMFGDPSQEANVPPEPDRPSVGAGPSNATATPRR